MVIPGLQEVRSVALQHVFDVRSLVDERCANWLAESVEQTEQVMPSWMRARLNEMNELQEELAGQRRTHGAWDSEHLYAGLDLAVV
jgi:hypothetical protein